MDMTLQQAMKVAADLEERGCLNEPAKAARVLLAHINSLASPQVTDERMAFEAAWIDIGGMRMEDYDFSQGANGNYWDDEVQAAWEIWQARALLSALPTDKEAIRNAALEEAATITDGLRCRPEFEEELQDRLLRQAGEKIRALQSQPQQVTDD